MLGIAHHNTQLYSIQILYIVRSGNIPTTQEIVSNCRDAMNRVSRINRVSTSDKAQSLKAKD